MKWLEGWFGIASGALGIVWIVITTIFVPLSSSSGYVGSQTCMTSSGGGTVCYGPDGAPISSNPPGPNVGLLILFAIILLLFIGVLVGTLLDLRSARTLGRVILLTSATLLLFAPFTALSAAGSMAIGSVAYIYPLTLLAFAAGVLACVRRDTPRPATPALG